MKRSSVFAIVPSLVCVLLLPRVAAAALEAAGPDEVVRRSADAVMSAVARHRDDYEADPEPLRAEIESILAERVAYESIARGVMGPHGRAASPEQVARFGERFEHSLIRLYTGALVAVEADSIEVGAAQELGEGRARVPMEVATRDGDSVDLQYALGRGDDGRWRVRNMLVDGINVGLTFRSQFGVLMEENGGDLDAVIDGWEAAAAGEVEIGD
jgi:phospholipid transport system substrate-binding protein